MPRIALLAALPFPLPQGSQVFVAEQACALARAGARVTLMCYGDGVDVPGGGASNASAFDASAYGTSDRGACALRVDDASVTSPRLVRAPRALSRTPLRAGPSWRKPLADLALLGSFVREARRERFDVVLAHNAEAVVVALAARSILRIPVVYVAHTLLRYELSAYAPRPLARLADAAGARLDAALARGADAVIALSGEAEARLGAAARGPVVRIPPALGIDTLPTAEHVAKTCARHGLTPGGFVLYAGNLDAYQDLDDLAHTAARIAPTPVLVATHQRRPPAPAPAPTPRIDDAATLRTLTAALHSASWRGVDSAAFP